MGRRITIEERRQPGTVAVREWCGGMLMREIVMELGEAESILFDGVKLCVEIEKRERLAASGKG